MKIDRESNKVKDLWVLRTLFTQHEYRTFGINHPEIEIESVLRLLCVKVLKGNRSVVRLYTATASSPTNTISI